MKALILSSLLLVSSLFPSAAEASQRTIEHIDRAYSITLVEMQAIYSGRYRQYRPETIRNVLGQILNEARPALHVAESEEARSSLASLIRSAEEEYNYSFRFQFYRLESTRLLIVNYQRLLQLARQSESIHAGEGLPIGPRPFPGRM